MIAQALRLTIFTQLIPDAIFITPTFSMMAMKLVCTCMYLSLSLSLSSSLLLYLVYILCLPPTPLSLSLSLSLFIPSSSSSPPPPPPPPPSSSLHSSRGDAVHPPRDAPGNAYAFLRQPMLAQPCERSLMVGTAAHTSHCFDKIRGFVRGPRSSSRHSRALVHQNIDARHPKHSHNKPNNLPTYPQTNEFY